MDANDQDNATRALRHGIETCALAIRKYTMDERRYNAVGRADLAAQARNSRQSMIDMCEMFAGEQTRLTSATDCKSPHVSDVTCTQTD